MIVVFDTNVWIRELALTSSVGSAIRFYLRQQNAHIGLPEVVKLETEEHLRTMLTEHIEDIQKRHRQILAIFGRLKEVVLPTASEIDAHVAQVFSKLGVPIKEIPFTIDSARSSLLRALRKLPPSDRNQQFKDGVLWADCLHLLEEEDVCLVSDDKAFYKSRDPALGLADELEQDVVAYPNRFAILPSLADLLRQIRTGVTVDPQNLVTTYLDSHAEKLHKMAGKHGFMLHGEADTNLRVFATEKPAFLYLDFSIGFPCDDATNEGRSEAKIRVTGEGTYDADTKNFELVTRRHELVFRLQDGTEKKVEDIVLVAGTAVVGHRTVEHSVRHEL